MCASGLHTQLPLGACGRGGHCGWHEWIEWDPSFQRWQRRGQELGPEGGEGGDKLHRGAKAHLGGARHGQGLEAGPGRPFARREPRSAWTRAESQPAGRLVSVPWATLRARFWGAVVKCGLGRLCPGGLPPGPAPALPGPPPEQRGGAPFLPGARRQGLSPVLGRGPRPHGGASQASSRPSSSLPTPGRPGPHPWLLCRPLSSPARLSSTWGTRPGPSRHTAYLAVSKRLIIARLACAEQGEGSIEGKTAADSGGGGGGTANRTPLPLPLPPTCRGPRS